MHNDTEKNNNNNKQQQRRESQATDTTPAAVQIQQRHKKISKWIRWMGWDGDTIQIEGLKKTRRQNKNEVNSLCQYLETGRVPFHIP